MNVSKPRPDDHPLLVLYIVGGITCSEVHQIREALAAYHPNTQVSDHVTIATENWQFGKLKTTVWISNLHICAS